MSNNDSHLVMVRVPEPLAMKSTSHHWTGSSLERKIMQLQLDNDCCCLDDSEQSESSSELIRYSKEPHGAQWEGSNQR